MKKLTIKNSDLLLRFIKIFGKIKTSFAKSLKGEEKLSVVFWGWVVLGNLVWVGVLTSIEFDTIGRFYGFFSDPVCKYFSSYGIRARVTCAVVSSALFFLMFISYPFLSQAMMLKSSEDRSINVVLRIVVKLLAIFSMIGLLVGFGAINLFWLVLSHESLFRN